MTVPFRPGYSKISDKVYVYDRYKVPKEEILAMLDISKRRVNDFFWRNEK